MKLRPQKSTRRVVDPDRPRFNAYWNGEPAMARRVVVRVGEAKAGWWCAPIVGEEHDAVEVSYNGQTFLLSDAGGQGWGKVTEGLGSPAWGHSSLPQSSEILRARAETESPAAGENGS